MVGPITCEDVFNALTISNFNFCRRAIWNNPESRPKGVGVTYANVYMLDSSVPKNDDIEAMLDVYR